NPVRIRTSPLQFLLLRLFHDGADGDRDRARPAHPHEDEAPVARALPTRLDHAHGSEERAENTRVEDELAHGTLLRPPSTLPRAACGMSSGCRGLRSVRQVGNG